MPDHFHVLFTPITSLEKAVQFIKGGFSHRAKVELGSSMEIWQKGFSDHRIRDAEDYTKHVEYIHRNPVKEGLCASADEYAYSSAYPGFERDPVPQRLKPLASAVAVGAAEAAPFQNEPQRLKPRHSAEANGAPEGAPFQSRNSASNEDNAAATRKEPQGLKPNPSVRGHGAAEAAPFQDKTKAHA